MLTAILCPLGVGVVGWLTWAAVTAAESTPDPAPNAQRERERERQADNEARVTYWRPL